MHSRPGLSTSKQMTRRASRRLAAAAAVDAPGAGDDVMDAEADDDVGSVVVDDDL